MKLIPPKQLATERPNWPYGYDGTLRLIRLGKLGCVRADRRVFVTDELLDAFIAANTKAAAK